MAAISWTGQFTMYDLGGFIMDANDGAPGVAATVTGVIDIAAGTFTVGSTDTFFSFTWSTTNGILFGPGTYTHSTIDPLPGVSGGNYTFTVGQGQLGGVVDFAWSSTSGIDVLMIWDVQTSGGVTTYTMTDPDGDGTPGTDMIDGPFTGFSANFNMQHAEVATPEPPPPPPPVVVPPPVAPPIFNVWQDGNLNDVSDLIRKVISTDSVKSNTLWRNASDSVDSTVSSFAVFKFGAAANDAGGLFGKFGGFSSSGFDDLGGDGGGFFGKFSGFRSSSVEGSDSVMWRKSGGDGGSGETGGGSLFGGAKSFVAADSQAESSPGFWFNTDGAFPI